MALDINSLTLGEVAKIEELSGQSITAIGEDSQPKGKAMAAMAMVASRRNGEPITWNQACGLTFEQAAALVGFDEEDSDTEADEGDEAEAVAREAAGLTPAGAPAGTGKENT